MKRFSWLPVVVLLELLPLSWADAQVKTVRLPFTQKHVEKSLGTDWYGVYLKNTKLGWCKTVFEKKTVANMPVYRVQLIGLMRAKSLGFVLESTFQESLEFDAAPPYALRRVISTRDDGNAKVVVTVERRGKGFVATTIVGKNKASRTIGPIDYTLGDEMTSYVWLMQKPGVGDVLTVKSFNSDKLKTDWSRYTVKAIKTTQVKGVKLTYSEVESISASNKTPMLSRFNNKGELLSGKIGGLLELRKEPEKLAKRLDKGMDLFLSGLVKIDRPLGASGRVAAMVVELQGKEAGKVPSTPRQTVVRTKEGKYLCKVGKKFGKRIKATKKELAETVEHTTTYPAKNPRIQKLAKQAVGDAKTPEEKVKRLVKFVHKFIRPSLGGKGTVVLSLLDRPRGDCTAYAAMFTTLARAAGVPSREVSGVAYMGDTNKAFGGHAWNEVVLNGVWHPIDASVGQFEVDAARITLGSAGDDQALDALLTSGTLSLRLIEMEKKRR